MKERGSSGVLLLILVIGLGIFSGINGTFSLFSKLFSIAAGVVVLGIAILVLVVLYFAFKQPKETKTQHDHQLMREGRMSLVELKNTGLKIKDTEIKHQLDAVCLEVEQILKNVQNLNRGERMSGSLRRERRATRPPPRQLFGKTTLTVLRYNLPQANFTFQNPPKNLVKFLYL
jgi:hypothetical protein